MNHKRLVQVFLKVARLPVSARNHLVSGGDTFWYSLSISSWHPNYSYSGTRR